MSINHIIRWLPCYICGTMILTSAPRVTCLECRAEVNRENARRRYKYKPDPNAYIVVNDPLCYEDGGFRKGAIINREELKWGINMQTFSVGTIFKIDGKQKIIREEGGKYILESMA